MEDQYHRIARWYDTIFEPLNSGLRQIGFKMHPVDAGTNVLDIGCGTGAHLKLYQDQKCKVAGIDLSEAMLKAARQKLGESADLQLCDATRMNFPDNRFDLIVCCTVLHEMQQEVRLQVLSEARRILKEDGRLLLIDFHPGPLKIFKGYFTKIIITVAELAAGSVHFGNYRNFMKQGGLPFLIAHCGFEVEQNKILSGGNFGIFVLKK